MDLSDDTVLVTGAAHGIGRATAEKFVDAGATVVLADVDEGVGRAAAAELDGGSTTAIFHSLDVSDYDAFEAVIEATDEEYGLDVLVNNAGLIHEAARLERTEQADLERLLDVNVRGTWNGCHAALPYLKDGDGGRIVNISSLAGTVGAPRLATYSLTKGAVLNFTRAVAAEAGRDGVRVNAVCPGFVDAGIAVDFFEDHDDPDEVREAVRRDYPLGRLGEPEEIAEAILWLGSERSSWVTGHGLVVDGGFSSY